MQSSNQIQFLPGFSAEQTASLTQLFQHALNQAFEQYFHPLPAQQKQATIVPKPAQLSEQEQEQKHCDTENIASSSSVIMEKEQARPYRASSADQRRLRIWLQSTGNPWAGIQAFSFGIPPLSLPGYIRCAEEMEATGQG